MKKQVSFDRNIKVDQFKLSRQKDLDQIQCNIQKININQQEPVTGNTMLHYSVMLDDLNTIKYLLTIKGINPFIKNLGGHSAYDIASEGIKDLSIKNENTRRQVVIKTLLDNYINHGLLPLAESAPAVMMHK